MRLSMLTGERLVAWLRLLWTNRFPIAKPKLAVKWMVLQAQWTCLSEMARLKMATLRRLHQEKLSLKSSLKQRIRNSLKQSRPKECHKNCRNPLTTTNLSKALTILTVMKLLPIKTTWLANFLRPNRKQTQIQPLRMVRKRVISKYESERYLTTCQHQVAIAKDSQSTGLASR